MSEKRTSRNLNDEGFLLGLSYVDVTGTALLLLLLLVVSRALQIGTLWALCVALSTLGALVPIRMKYRRKILRDTGFYIVKKGVIRVSKNS